MAIVATTVPINHRGILPVVPTLDIFSTPLKSTFEVLAKNNCSLNQKKLNRIFPNEAMANYVCSLVKEVTRKEYCKYKNS